MSDLYRSRTMDQISEADIGEELKIAGWVRIFVTTAAFPSLT